MTKNLNPFYEWLKVLKKSNWGKFAIAILLIAISDLPGWLPYLINLNVDNLPNWVSRININFTLQVIVLSFGAWFFNTYNRHFEKQKFSKEIDIFLKAEDVKILHVTDEEDGRRLKNYALKCHQNFIRRIYHLYISLIAIYIVFLVEQNITYDNSIKNYIDVVFTSLKIIINSFAILTLFRLYYILAYSYKFAKNYLKQRMDGLRVLVWTLCSVAIITLLFNLKYNFSDNLVVEILSIAGILTGITFAVFFGKLDGALIGTPTTILWVGYTYSLIQATFFLFSTEIKHPIIFQVVLYIALLIKIILVIYFFWIVRKSRILIYSIFQWNIFLRTQHERKKLETILEKIESKVEEDYNVI